MIVDVPEHTELSETAIGWLSLAWEETLETIGFFNDWQEYSGQFDEADEKLAAGSIRSYWHQHRFKLNNAVSMLQQSMELLLKARIAKVSPYLLITGDPQTWPRPNSQGHVSFTEFRTIDASQLCRAAIIACSEPIHLDFNSFFERIRRHRNKIAHLNAGNISIEARHILKDILDMYGFLFPDESWIDFRRRYVDATRKQLDEFDDWSHSIIMSEIRLASSVLENYHTKRYFDYDKRKRHLFCPNCEYLKHKHDDDGCNFAHKRKDGSIHCAACKIVFTKEAYKDAVKQWE